MYQVINVSTQQMHQKQHVAKCIQPKGEKADNTCNEKQYHTTMNV